MWMFLFLLRPNIVHFQSRGNDASKTTLRYLLLYFLTISAMQIFRLRSWTCLSKTTIDHTWHQDDGDVWQGLGHCNMFLFGGDCLIALVPWKFTTCWWYVQPFASNHATTSPIQPGDLQAVLVLSGMYIQPVNCCMFQLNLYYWFTFMIRSKKATINQLVLWFLYVFTLAAASVKLI